SKKPGPSSRCRHNVPSVRWKDCIGAKRPAGGHAVSVPEQVVFRHLMQAPRLCDDGPRSETSGTGRLCNTGQEGTSLAGRLPEFRGICITMALKRSVWHYSAPTEIS